MRNRVLQMLGIAAKSGNVVSGEFSTEKSVKSGKSFLVIVADDASENTKKKFGKQQLMTDTGIEIKIPMEQYNSTDSIEFITNEDGTISVLIKNIGKITSK